MKLKELLTSRAFWLAVIALVVIVVSTVSPTFELDKEAAAGLAVIVCSYLLGIAFDPGMPGWRGILQSRKFWAAVIGFLVMILNGFHIDLPFGLTESVFVEIALVIGGWITSMGVKDMLGRYQIVTKGTK